MKFKKGDRVEYIGSNDSGFTRGAIYTVREDELNKYGHLTIELDDNGSNTNGHRPEYFKLIEENKMRTDKKVMAEIYRKMAENLDEGLDENDSIQCSCGSYGWGDKNHVGINSLYEYRIKPETITLKNGVTIPKPLDVDSIDNDKFYYYPCVDRDYFDRADGRRIKDSGTILFYASMNEAREAGKALFGIE